MSKVSEDVLVDSIFETKHNGKLQVLQYINAHKVYIRFLSTGYKTYTQASKIRKGNVRDYMRPSVFNKGFIGEGTYNSRTKYLGQTIYTVWHNMFERCYSQAYHVKQPTYISCDVCAEWYNFQNFAKWFEANYVEGTQLDKDLIETGNKLYSPDTCLFVPRSINNEKAQAKYYILRNPVDEYILVYNLRKFCTQLGLNYKSMWAVHAGTRKQHKGWKKG